MKSEDFFHLALSFPATERNPHHERTAFKIVGKKIFATYLEKHNSANIVLPANDQSTFCEYDTELIFPVPNKWGEKGWTTFLLDNLDSALIQEALLAAYNHALGKV